ncbi:MAG: NHLP bacteriocin system secretion protein [Cyanobacteria bacterium P01_A01_bin.40]
MNENFKFRINSQEEAENHHCSELIRVLIIEDTSFAREVLSRIVASEANLELAGSFPDAETAFERIGALQPDVILLDIEMPGIDGIQACKIITERFTNCKVIILSCHDSKEYLNGALRAGAKGYLQKGIAVGELKAAINLVHKGYSQIGPGLLEKIITPDLKSLSLSSRTESSLSKNNDSNDSSALSLIDKLRASKNGVVNQLIRKEVVEYHSSPKELDQLTQVVSSRAWLPLATIGILSFLTITWSVFGRIPVFAEGQGMLLRPRRVVQFQSPSSGLLISLNVESGDEVEKGETIGIVDQSELRQELQQEQNKLDDLLEQKRTTDVLQQQGTSGERRTLEQQKLNLQKSLSNAIALTPVLRTNNLGAITQSRQSLEQQLQQLRRLLPALEKRRENRRSLARERAISQDALLEAEQDYFSRLAQISDLEVQLKQLSVQEAQAEQEYVENLNLIEDLKAKIKENEARQTQLSKQDLEESLEKTNEVKETKRRIEQIKLQLANRTNIVSPHDGKILEIGTVPGKTVEPGMSLGTIEIEDKSASLIGVTYFADKDGKQIEPEMKTQITPSVVKRERFGGITGKITKVSSFPVTVQDMATIIGNQDLAQNFADKLAEGSEGAMIQVFSELEKDADTLSGYRWSSSTGPNLTISSGTTTSVRVKVEERAPISYVIPLLKSLTGIN